MPTVCTVGTYVSLGCQFAAVVDVYFFGILTLTKVIESVGSRSETIGVRDIVELVDEHVLFMAGTGTLQISRHFILNGFSILSHAAPWCGVAQYGYMAWRGYL